MEGGRLDLWTPLTALATAGAAGLVYVQLRREATRERVRCQTNRARIAAIAYKLRRQLRSWVGTDHEHFDRWIADRGNDGSFARHLDRAEELLDQLMALRPDADSKVAGGLDAAFILFLEGTRRLNEHVSTPRPALAGQIEWIQGKFDAEADLRECISQLEGHVIEKSVLGSEAALLERRQKGSVLEQALSGEEGDEGP
jgi:hypothetical protein